MRSALDGAHFAIWTTTPWTIPANLAVAVNDALDYSVVEVQVCFGKGGAGGARSFIAGASVRHPPVPQRSALFCVPRGRKLRPRVQRPAAAVVGPSAAAAACPGRLQGDLPEGWQARRLVVAADLAGPLAEKFGVTLSTLATVK